MENILTPQIISNLIVTILPLIALYIISPLIKTGAEHLKAKTGNDKANKYIDLAENAVETAVTVVSQIIVDAAKKNGAFDQAAREEAFYDAKQRALSIMADETKKAISEAYGDLNAWIDNKIEFYVKTGKPS